MYGRIRAAMEEAEEARLARDSALVGQKELQKEAEVSGSIMGLDYPRCTD